MQKAVNYSPKRKIWKGFRNQKLFWPRSALPSVSPEWVSGYIAHWPNTIFSNLSFTPISNLWLQTKNHFQPLCVYQSISNCRIMLNHNWSIDWEIVKFIVDHPIHPIQSLIIQSANSNNWHHYLPWQPPVFFVPLALDGFFISQPVLQVNPN